MPETGQDKEFLKRLQATFRMEAREHMQNLSANLQALGRDLPDRQADALLEDSFREAHSLKGAARAVNQSEIERVCHALEDVFASLKRRTLALSPPLIDLLQEGADSLDMLLQEVSADKGEASQSKSVNVSKRLRDASRGIGDGGETDGPAPAQPPPPEEAVRPVRAEDRGGSTIRVRTEKLDSLMLRAEELLSIKLYAAERAKDLFELGSACGEWEKRFAALRTAAAAGERNRQGEPGAVGEFLQWNAGFIKDLNRSVSRIARAADQDRHQTARLIDELLVDAKSLVMQPFSSLLEIFPRLVRELSRERGKEVELVLRGGEIEVDRRIAEGVKDPLIHMVRNCVDHGIEAPRERERAGKSRRGRVAILLSLQEGNRVEIAVSDDGAGIDVEALKGAALKKGIVSAEEAATLTGRDAHALIFESGISTSPLITEVSGRGLGLAILREKTEKLGGTITVESSPGSGTTIRLLLPLTVSTFRGVLVSVQGRPLIIPTRHVDQALRISREAVRTVKNRETVVFGGASIAFARLADVLGYPPASPPAGPAGERHLYVVVVAAAEKRVALQVDGIHEELEILLKDLGSQLVSVRNIAGSTVLGNLQVAPVLNVPELIASAVKRPSSAPAPAGEVRGDAVKTILVADDSITSRSLLKNILETAGYVVKTAVDGAEALALLKTEPCDMVVSDVEMPRMSGFELTAGIRADKRLAEMPVILVTGLASREDRERGIDVGANAYIVKSNFDQSDLLEIIGRLL